MLHGHVTDQEIGDAVRSGTKEGAFNGAVFGAVGGINAMGQFGVSAIGMAYSGLGYYVALQSYLSGNVEAGDFESAMAMIGAVSSVPGLVGDSVLGARGLTAALENSCTGPKSFVNIKSVSKAVANAEHPNSPPYAGDAIDFNTGRTQYFVRIMHIGNMHSSEGGFLTTAESVIGKSRSELKQMFALQGDVVGIQVVKVPPGIRMRAGRVAAQPNWGNNNPGNAVQYQLLEDIADDNFSGQIIPVEP
jgi:hypothetical protein